MDVVRACVLGLSSAAALLGLAASCAGGATPPPEAGEPGYCDPGSDVFCRCRGRAEPGTKRCNSAGTNFGACESAAGSCVEVMGEGPGDGNAEGKSLLAACETDGDCQSGMCRYGFCTQECAKYQECNATEKYEGDCLKVDASTQLCVPVCEVQQDCAEFGKDSMCGFGLAVDAFAIIVCFDFQGPSLPNEGFECESDEGCHLGITGQKLVCEAGNCVGGCHGDADCPEGEKCSVGAPGTCGAGGG
jgi:hypothetical protein